MYQDEIIGVTRGAAPYIAGRYDPGQVNIHFSLGYFQNFILDILYNGQ
jgi:hypothetical protein